MAARRGRWLLTKLWNWRASFPRMSQSRSSTAYSMRFTGRELPPSPPPAKMLENLRVVLVSPRNPLNVGAAARAMSNFGCFDLRLVQAYRKAVDEAKAAVKGGRVVTEAKEFGSVAEAVADCTVVVGATGREHREFEHPYLRLEAASPKLRKVLQRG